MKSGIEYMVFLSDWYQKIVQTDWIFSNWWWYCGDFQYVWCLCCTKIWKCTMSLWSYFCQISDSTTSYGSYSGAVPNEKITWGKLDIKTPKFIIESDAIVAPLNFAYLLDL
jgi:deoxyhypusine synthase